MAKPTDLPEFASSANYSDPGKPWDATQTKIEPPDEVKEQGFKPKDRPPAQYLAWILYTIYTWILWLNSLFGADGSLTLEPGADVEVSGDGQYRHGTRTITIPLLSIDEYGVAPSEKTTLTSPNFLCIPIPPLPTGKRILKARATVKDSATGPTKVTLSIRKNGGGVNTRLAEGAASAGTGVDNEIETLTMIGTGHEYVVAGAVYSVEVAYSTGAENVDISKVQVDFDEPAPP